MCKNIMAGYAADRDGCGDGVGGAVPPPTLGVLGTRIFFEN